MRPAAAALAGAALGMLCAIRVHADCQCPPATPQDDVEAATEVFRGTIDEIRVPKKTGPTQYLFVVNDTFKGDSNATEFLLQDADADGACALALAKNKEYLVYARWEWGYLKTARCWGTKPIEKANGDRAAIGPGDEWKEKLYPKMREACMGTYVTPCCLDSVKAMEKGHFLPEPDGGCADGFKPNVVNCNGSLRWCEPIAGGAP